jgi:glycerol kinase
LVRTKDSKNLILSLDQGTTNSKTILFTASGSLVSQSKHGLKQCFPHSGWVEQDPEKIWVTILRSARESISLAKSVLPSVIAITNQRETTLLWEKSTLKPVFPAIVWQDRRSFKICERLRNGGYNELVRERTGLLIDPYFSATKLAWIFENNPKLRKRAEAEEICFGTVDSFLLSRLTGGEVFATDHTNASRTMLFDTLKLRWDDELLSLLKVPSGILPEVKPSGSIFGETLQKFFGKKITIGAMIGDQQSALFGQAIFKPGMAKNTFGTGNFLLEPVGMKRLIDSSGRLLSTIAWSIGSDVTYALEGSIFSTGSVMQWLREGLKILPSWSGINKFSSKLGTNEDLYFVPALAGLGAPHWDPRARGMLIGITGGTTRADVVRAALESISYQSRDVLEAFEKSIGRKIDTVRVDGGGSANDLLMQFFADITGKRVQRPRVVETTARGAAQLASLTVGFWNSPHEIEGSWKLDREFVPDMNEEVRDELYQRWTDAVNRSRSWARDKS